MTASRTVLAGLAISICTIFACGCQKPTEPAAVKATNPGVTEGTIVAVGDSLTAGLGVAESDAYPAQLERKLRQAGYRWRVVNAGISGETSSGTLSRIDWIMKLNPDIVILEIGANDGMRGIDPRLIESNIDKIVSSLLAKNVPVVLAGMQMLTSMGPAYTARFAAIYPEIGRERALLRVPFFLDKVAGEPSLNLADGIHPNAAGYRVVADTVYPYLLQAIEQKKKGTRQKQ